MKRSSQIIVVLLQLSAVVMMVNGQIDCDWLDPVSKIHYDLTPLKQVGLDYTFVVPNNGNPITYYINVCTPTAQIACGTNIAGCQVWNNGDASIGLATSLQLGPIAASANWNGEGLTGQWTGGDAGRNFQIDFECNKAIDKGTPVFVGEVNSHYTITWQTKYACNPKSAPADGGSGSDDDGGLSGGSIFLIILLVVVVVYFVGGVVVNKFVRHTEGVADTIPNAGFWGSIPGLVRDGFKFVIGKVRGTSGSAGTYQQTA